MNDTNTKVQIGKKVLNTAKIKHFYEKEPSIENDPESEFDIKNYLLNSPVKEPFTRVHQ